ncbi:MAG: hypothetical protein NVS2B3_02590 [Vulcanimicrobiaceae bacterium]
MTIDADLTAVQRRIAEIAGSDSAREPVRALARHAAVPAPVPAAPAFTALVRESYEALARRGGRAIGVDPALVAAVAETESGFDPAATSRTGAAGLMQLMPATARSLGVADPYDPVQNVRAGAVYLQQLLERFHASVPLAVAAYNAGPGAVERFAGVPPYAETRAYVARVMAAYRARGGT